MFALKISRNASRSDAFTVMDASTCIMIQSGWGYVTGLNTYFFNWVVRSKYFVENPESFFVLFTNEYQEYLIFGKQGTLFKLGNFPLRETFSRFTKGE